MPARSPWLDNYVQMFGIKRPNKCLRRRRIANRRSSMLRITTLLALLLWLGTPAAKLLDSQSAAPPALGQVDFPTSCSKEAQPSVETALLHSFQYEQAS